MLPESQQTCLQKPFCLRQTVLYICLFLKNLMQCVLRHCLKCKYFCTYSLFIVAFIEQVKCFVQHTPQHKLHVSDTRGKNILQIHILYRRYTVWCMNGVVTSCARSTLKSTRFTCNLDCNFFYMRSIFFNQHSICTISCPRERYYLKLLYEGESVFLFIRYLIKTLKFGAMCVCVSFFWPVD